MKSAIALLIVGASLVAAGQAYAQETSPGPGRLEVTMIPAGGTWFLHKDEAPSFGNYDVGAATAYNFTRILGVEGEVAGSFGLTQHLNDSLAKLDTPNMVSYTVNMVANWSLGAIVPYAAGGVGGLSVFERREIEVTDTKTYFTGNIGGGAKWFASNGRWGLRGDYRLIRANGADSTSAFFGSEHRFANRIYGAVIINAIK